MTVRRPLWHRNPILFAIGLSATTISGLTIMLADADRWKAIGFVLSILPLLAAACGYLVHRR